MVRFTGSVLQYPARAALAWYAGLIAIGSLKLNPDGEFKLTDDQILFVIGRKSDLNRLGDLN